MLALYNIDYQLVAGVVVLYLARKRIRILALNGRKRMLGIN